MDSKLQIGLDMDGVFYDFKRGVKQQALQLIEDGDIDTTKVTLDEDPEGYFFWDENWNLPKSFVDNNVYEIFNQGGILFNVRKIINSWNEKYEVIIITSPWAGTKSDEPNKQLFHLSSVSKMDWLARMGIKYSSILFTHNKSLLNMDVLIDDGLHNHQKLVETNHKAIHIGYDMNGMNVPRFLDITKGRESYYCETWDEIDKTVKNLEKKFK